MGRATQFLGTLAYLWPGVSSRLHCQPTAFRSNGFQSEPPLVATAVGKGIIFMGKRLGDSVRTLPLKVPEYHLVSLRLSLKGNKGVLEKQSASLQKKSPQFYESWCCYIVLQPSGPLPTAQGEQSKRPQERGHYLDPRPDYTLLHPHILGKKVEQHESSWRKGECSAWPPWHVLNPSSDNPMRFFQKKETWSMSYGERVKRSRDRSGCSLWGHGRPQGSPWNLRGEERRSKR